MLLPDMCINVINRACNSTSLPLLQVQAAANRAEQILPEFTPQAMANLMWAFAAMSHNPGELNLMPASRCLHWLDVQAS